MKPRRLVHTVTTFVLVSALIYLGIASVLILSDGPGSTENGESGFDFRELFFDDEGLPALQVFRARDGASLSYRHYPSDSSKVLILIHGSGYHSRYLLPLARFISARGLAHVYTPDLRGHGPSPARRGDIDYIGQFEDDLADLLGLVRKAHPEALLIMGGHSSGGGLALRFAGSSYGGEANAYLLLSPFLKYNAPTVRPQTGGWAQPFVRRIAGLVMLNRLGIRWLNHLKVIRFNMPEEARDGTETLLYSYRLNTGFAPENYQKDLEAIGQPLLVLAGSADEAFYADRFEPVITRYTQARVEVLEDVTHMGVVVGEKSRPVIRTWMEALGDS